MVNNQSTLNKSASLEDLILILLNLSSNSESEREEMLESLFGMYYKRLLLKIGLDEQLNKDSPEINKIISSLKSDNISHKEALEDVMKIEGILDDNKLIEVYQENLEHFMIRLISTINSCLPEESRPSFNNYLKEAFN